MIIHIPSGRSFENRKQAKKEMGQEAYKKAVADREFSFHDERLYVPFEETTDWIDGLLREYNNK